ncbi:hypothetical protein TanjilG_31296 [Lupinus angustifolius]|uniref:RING-type E3 ubiquitin transferase n=1 Tax=Lupinus angustifolius TaxID=3871 RepID=A0A4P1RT59_LUPAN|nr:PREDICTED: RING-H2 finger protein ATL78-like [Lupinus angustifolius]OIW18176.1 hypothetical protein TanjilG_31296 [Lupinus angustifolius]
MYASTSHLVHDLLGDSHTRRLLLQNTLNQSPNSANSPAPSIHSHNSTNLFSRSRNFDANVVMLLSVLLCGVICFLGLSAIIMCVLKCSNYSSRTSNQSPKLANTGIKKKVLKTFPIVTYSAEMNLSGLDTECVICLSEFTKDDKVRVLPKCNHGFHVPCIDKWLNSHSSCPKCRQCLIETCHKIVGSQPATVVPLPLPESIIRIEPLEPEGLVCNYRESS